MSDEVLRYEPADDCPLTSHEAMAESWGYEAEIPVYQRTKAKPRNQRKEDEPWKETAHPSSCFSSFGFLDALCWM